MSELWHGNDDPPKVGAHIEYIMRGEIYQGYFSEFGKIKRPTCVKDVWIIDHLQDVSQWRLASSGE